MVKVHIIGKGKWGKVIENSISHMVEFTNPYDADWVIISTPNDLHYEQTLYWLSQGKNVFCEKPLTLNLDSLKSLYELADDNEVKLYVDDVFDWRDDYEILEDDNYFRWIKPGYEKINFLERLSYHHFYIWLKGKTNCEVNKVSPGDQGNFRVELKDGTKAVFQYGGREEENVHEINGYDMSSYDGYPLEDMFTAIFDGEADLEKNRQNTINATYLLEQVKEVVYKKALVVGAGVFGLTSAISLSHNGYNVIVREKDDDLMKGASSINQYRLHKGYHYPRSKETAQECLDGLKTFKRKYQDSVVNGSITHMYSIASENSMVSGKEYKEFLDDMNLPYEEREPGINCDLTIVADEELFNPEQLTLSLHKKLYSSGVKVYVNSEVKNLDEEKFDVSVIATYSQINQLLNEKKEYQYEVCEKPVVKLPKTFENTSIVVMDGPFMCLDPYMGGTHVLGNVVHAIHETNIGTEPIVSDELKPYLNKGIVRNPNITNIDKFIESGVKYFGDEFKDLEHIGSMYTIRTVLSNKEKDDARPTLVEKVKDNVYTLFSGKIDTCVNAANQLIQRIQND